MKMTFDEYDQLVESFKAIDSPTIWPSIDQIMIMEEDPEKWVEFAIYLLEKGKNPVNKEEEYRKRLLNLFLTENLEIINT